jgi:hypothetical protein
MVFAFAGGSAVAHAQVTVTELPRFAKPNPVMIPTITIPTAPGAKRVLLPTAVVPTPVKMPAMKVPVMPSSAIERGMTQAARMGITGSRIGFRSSQVPLALRARALNRTSFMPIAARERMLGRTTPDARARLERFRTGRFGRR